MMSQPPQQNQFEQQLMMSQPPQQNQFGQQQQIRMRQGQPSIILNQSEIDALNPSIKSKIISMTEENKTMEQQTKMLENPVSNMILEQNNMTRI